MAYNVYTYNGSMWLDGPEAFETEDEAADYILDVCEDMAAGMDDSDVELWREAFYANSRIEEVN